jgi:hypothetical protein
MLFDLTLGGAMVFLLEFDKKNYGGWGASFGYFAGVFEGGVRNRAFFDCNLLVDLW